MKACPTGLVLSISTDAASSIDRFNVNQTFQFAGREASAINKRVIDLKEGFENQ